MPSSVPPPPTGTPQSMSGSVGPGPMGATPPTSMGIPGGGIPPHMHPHGLPPHMHHQGMMMQDAEMMARGMQPGMPAMHPGLPPGMHPHMAHPGQRFMRQPDFRIFEMNKRLQLRSDDCDQMWWESFANEFFEDDATLTISCMMEDGPKRFAIGRTMIPRYFRSIFESGASELYFMLRHTRESFHNTWLAVESEPASQVMTLTRPCPCTVVVEGRLVLEFTCDELLRIRAWHFQIRGHREMILRSVVGMQDGNMMEQLSKNITRNGIPFNTLNFFRLCMILEPMQELMSRQKAYSLTPRDCLKTTLFQKWQRMVAPPGQPQKTEASRPASKRRKRKAANANSDSGSTKGKRKQSPAPATPAVQPGEVMLVGEPTLMGGEFGEEDERQITRLENNEFDANGNSTATLPPQSQETTNQRPRSSDQTGTPRSTATPNSAGSGKATARPKSASNNGVEASPKQKDNGGPVSGVTGTNNSGSAPPSVSGPGSVGTPGPPLPVSTGANSCPPGTGVMMPPHMMPPGPNNLYPDQFSEEAASGSAN